MTVSAFGARSLLAAAFALAALTPAVRAQGWGNIQGQVTFVGAVPEREKIKVNKDEAHCTSKGPLLSESLIVNPKNKGVKNVVVFLIDGSGDAKKPLPINPSLKKPSKEVEEIDQPCCQFVPHVLAMRNNQTLVIKNSAPVSHNVHLLAGPLEFNVILPPGGVRKVLPSDLPVRPRANILKCDIHGWMGGWVWVFAHPYFAVTDEDGKFRIKGAPAGNWRIVMWQDNGWVNGDSTGQPITVKDGETTDLGKVAMTPPKD